MKNTLKTISILLILTISFVACDKDFNTIGSDILSDQGFTTSSFKFPTVAYTKTLNPVRSSNLTSSLLGVYNDPVYGLTTASIVTQVIPTSFNPIFGDDPEIESVILNIPYFSRLTGELDNDGNTGYALDSLYGEAPMKLSIYQNNYFLRNLDPSTNLEEEQLYYSNSNSTIDFDSHTGELFYENNFFSPDPSEIIIEEVNEEGETVVTERLRPALRVDLASTEDLKEFWASLLFENEGNPVLSNANQFTDFFRGLYFKTENVNNDGSMLLLDFISNGANISVNYFTTTFSTNENDEVVETRNDFTYQINLNGNKVNIIENNFSSPINDGDEINGDETIYLKGTEGAMAVVNLFDGTITDENNIEWDAFDYFLDEFKNPDGSMKKLVNEAKLTFYVDQLLVNGQEPDRVILYDLKNNTPLVDYFFDLTNSNFPAASKINHSRILERDEDGNGIKYRIRLTEHINNILLRDSTNVSLGLVVSTNVNSVDQLSLLGSEDELVNTVPLCQFLSPRGTVLHGSTDDVPEDKRVKFEIFYSEPTDAND